MLFIKINKINYEKYVIKLLLFMTKPTRGVFHRKTRVLQRQNVLKVHFVCIAKRVTGHV